MDMPLKKLTHQEILLSKPTVEETKKFARIPVVLVLDNLRSLYNIGSIFRTADALLIEKIYLCGICGHPPNHQIEKVALGAEETVPFEYWPDVNACLQKLKEDGLTIVALELTHQSKHYKLAEYQFPMALVAGNEVEGIGEEAIKLCDQAIDIPMKGRANSLNVATAMAVAGYEIYDRCVKLKS
jgi:tRNA G18 (ribose-2'-O)-methylase SpoU